MKTKKKVVLTNNREIYEKLNMLNFSNEIVLTNVKPVQINKIIKNVNKTSRILSSEVIGNYIIIRKHSPLNFNVYLNK